MGFAGRAIVSKDHSCRRADHSKRADSRVRGGEGRYDTDSDAHRHSSRRPRPSSRSPSAPWSGPSGGVFFSWFCVRNVTPHSGLLLRWLVRRKAKGLTVEANQHPTRPNNNPIPLK